MGAGGGGDPRRARRNLVVADHPRDLLHQVVLAFDVRAPTWRHHPPAAGHRGDPHPQPLQQRAHLAALHLRPQKARNLGAAEVDGGRLGREAGRARIGDRTRLAARERHQQLGRALQRRHLPLRVDPAFKAVRGVGVHAELARLAEQRGRRKKRRLKIDVAGGGGNRGVEPAHDAGQRERFLVVGNHQMLAGQRDLIAVEKAQFFARFGAPHDDAAGEFIHIEGVHGLPQFQHHIVGYIDHHIEAAHPAAPQPLGKPVGGARRHVDVAHRPPGISRAVARRAQLHRQVSRARRDAAVFGRHAQFRAGQRRHFARDAEHAEAVTAVGGEFQFDDGVGEVEVVGKRRADRGVRVEQKHPVGLLRQTEFGRGAQHPGRFHPVDGARFDRERRQFRPAGGDRRFAAGDGVGRAADDAERGATADIHLADFEVRRAGMRFAADNLADDDPLFVQRRSGRGHRRDFQPAEGQAFCQLAEPNGGRDPFAQPRMAD